MEVVEVEGTVRTALVILNLLLIIEVEEVELTVYILTLLETVIREYLYLDTLKTADIL